MRDGFRAFDADTHVNPAADVLDRYVDPSFRPRLAELAPYRVASGQMIGGTPGTDQYRVATKLYRRVLGQAGPHESFTGRGTHWMGTRQPRVGVQDDQAENRVKDMDDEGTDAHFLVPTSWVSVVGLPDVELEVGLIRAYHRHAADFCGQFPGRLKTAIVASTRAVDEAVREIHRWGTSKWAVAVLPVLGKDMPLDHPDLEPIWQAAQEHDLAVVHHSNTWNPPVLPRLPGSLGQHLPRASGVTPLGRHAVHGRLHRGRDHGPLSPPAHGHPRVRLRLAALLGETDGRAGGVRGRASRRSSTPPPST